MKNTENTLVSLQVAAMLLGCTSIELSPYVSSGALPSFHSEGASGPEPFFRVGDIETFSKTAKVGTRDDQEWRRRLGLPPKQQDTNLEWSGDPTAGDWISSKWIENLIQEMREVNHENLTRGHTDTEREQGYEILRTFTRLANEVVAKNTSVTSIEQIEDAAIWLAVFAQSALRHTRIADLPQRLEKEQRALNPKGRKSDHDIIGYCAATDPDDPELPDNLSSFGVITHHKTDVLPVYYKTLTRILRDGFEPLCMDRAAIEAFEDRVSRDLSLKGYHVDIRWQGDSIGYVSLQPPEQNRSAAPQSGGNTGKSEQPESPKPEAS